MLCSKWPLPWPFNKDTWVYSPTLSLIVNHIFILMTIYYSSSFHMVKCSLEGNSMKSVVLPIYFFAWGFGFWNSLQRRQQNVSIYFLMLKFIIILSTFKLALLEPRSLIQFIRWLLVVNQVFHSFNWITKPYVYCREKKTHLI